jgi:hypothetical protein
MPPASLRPTSRYASLGLEASAIALAFVPDATAIRVLIVEEVDDEWAD